MKKILNLLVFLSFIFAGGNSAAIAEESKVQPPVITNEKLREYKDFILEF